MTDDFPLGVQQFLPVNHLVSIDIDVVPIRLDLKAIRFAGRRERRRRGAIHGRRVEHRVGFVATGDFGVAIRTDRRADEVVVIVGSRRNRRPCDSG